MKYEVWVKFPSGVETLVHDRGKTFTRGKAEQLRTHALTLQSYKNAEITVQKVKEHGD